MTWQDNAYRANLNVQYTKHQVDEALKVAGQVERGEYTGTANELDRHINALKYSIRNRKAQVGVGINNPKGHANWLAIEEAALNTLDSKKESLLAAARATSSQNLAARQNAETKRRNDMRNLEKTDTNFPSLSAKK